MLASNSLNGKLDPFEIRLYKTTEVNLCDLRSYPYSHYENLRYFAEISVNLSGDYHSKR